VTHQKSRLDTPGCDEGGGFTEDIKENVIQFQVGDGQAV